LTAITRKITTGTMQIQNADHAPCSGMMIYLLSAEDVRNKPLCLIGSLVVKIMPLKMVLNVDGSMRWLF